MHDGTHICAVVMGRERDEPSSATLVPPRSLIINSVGIRCSFKKKGPALLWRTDNLSCAVRVLSARVQCSVSKGRKDLRLFEVTEMTWGRQSLYKANINCATSSENNGGQDTECALIHISIVCPPLLLLLRAWSISGVKEGGEKRRRGSSSGGSGGLAVFFLLCLCANAQTVQ